MLAWLARCNWLAYGPANAQSSHASWKSTTANLTFWCRLTQFVTHSLTTGTLIYFIICTTAGAELALAYSKISINPGNNLTVRLITKIDFAKPNLQTSQITSSSFTFTMQWCNRSCTRQTPQMSEKRTVATEMVWKVLDHLCGHTGLAQKNYNQMENRLIQFHLVKYR